VLIFDCDGVLVDSEKIYLRVLKEELEKLVPGIDLTPFLARAPGLQTSDITRQVEEAAGVVFPNDTVARIDETTHQALDFELEPMPGIENMLAGLRGDKAVVSNSGKERVIKSLELTGLDGFNWKAIFSAEQVERPKPAPDLYLHAAAELNVSPSECLVVEDSVTGVTAATQAGARVVGFIGASHVVDGQDQRLIAAGAEIVVHHMKDLLRVLFALRPDLVVRGTR